MKRLFINLFLLVIFSYANAQQSIIIEEQGAFSAGGTVIKSEGTFDATKPWNEPQGGQTRHGNHADVFYQVPANAKQNAMVFLHGYGQSRRSWQTTPDGREGFSNIFLKKGYKTYLVDQPGRGEAGQTTVPVQIMATPDDQTWYTQFRIGLYPEFNDGVQFPQDEKSLDQFYRQMTPNTALLDNNIISDAMSAVMDKSGDAILFTHSAGGVPGWLTAIKNNHVKAIVAIEPGGFTFPESETPEGNYGGPGVPMDEFMKLTKIPIVVYYGDYIPDANNKTNAASLIFWRHVLESARQWAKVVNAHGGDVTIVHLPEMGIKGNTHFMMSDLNNKDISEVIEKWIQEKGLDIPNSLQTTENNTGMKDEIVQLSKDKWQWMADKNVDKLSALFDAKAKFVHMGGTWGTEQELQVIKSGGIWYKKADVHETSVEFFGNDMAIVWNSITLLAVVGGNEVSNPFMVTEVYHKENNHWKLADLTFSKLLN